MSVWWDICALTFGVLCQKVFQLCKSPGYILQPVPQVEVLLLQGVDGVLQLIWRATMWVQKNPPKQGSGLKDGQHCWQLHTLVKPLRLVEVLLNPPAPRWVQVKCPLEAGLVLHQNGSTNGRVKDPVPLQRTLQDQFSGMVFRTQIKETDARCSVINDAKKLPQKKKNQVIIIKKTLMVFLQFDSLFLWEYNIRRT